MKKNRILITGAGGALGKILVDLLDNNDECVLPLVKHNHKEIKDTTKCDIQNFNSLSKIMCEFKPTHVIHLAGLTGNLECEENPEQAFQNNVFGTYNILKCCIKNKPKIIFASSREVYGDTKLKVNEKSKLKPKNINGLTKMLSENLILNFNLQYEIPYTILRFTNFYGENYSKRGISKMIKIAMRGEKISIYGGNQMIDLLHHDDAGIAILKALNMKDSEIYNIGSGKSITISYLLKQIEKICDKKIPLERKPYRSFEVRNFRIDNSKAKSKMKFEPRLGLNEVLKRMYAKQIS